MLFLAVLFLGAAAPAAAQNVKITPLGSHDGELCPLDRALIFEDPDGTRIMGNMVRMVGFDEHYDLYVETVDGSSPLMTIEDGDYATWQPAVP